MTAIITVSKVIEVFLQDLDVLREFWRIRRKKTHPQSCNKDDAVKMFLNKVDILMEFWARQKSIQKEIPMTTSADETITGQINLDEDNTRSSGLTRTITGQSKSIQKEIPVTSSADDTRTGQTNLYEDNARSGLTVNKTSNKTITRQTNFEEYMDDNDDVENNPGLGQKAVNNRTGKTNMDNIGVDEVVLNEEEDQTRTGHSDLDDSSKKARISSGVINPAAPNGVVSKPARSVKKKRRTKRDQDKSKTRNKDHPASPQKKHGCANTQQSNLFLENPSLAIISDAPNGVYNPESCQGGNKKKVGTGLDKSGLVPKAKNKTKPHPGSVSNKAKTSRIRTGQDKSGVLPKAKNKTIQSGSVSSAKTSRTRTVPDSQSGVSDQANTGSNPESHLREVPKLNKNALRPMVVLTRLSLVDMKVELGDLDPGSSRSNLSYSSNSPASKLNPGAKSNPESRSNPGSRSLPVNPEDQNQGFGDKPVKVEAVDNIIEGKENGLDSDKTSKSRRKRKRKRQGGSKQKSKFSRSNNWQRVQNEILNTQTSLLQQIENSMNSAGLLSGPNDSRTEPVLDPPVESIMAISAGDRFNVNTDWSSDCDSSTTFERNRKRKSEEGETKKKQRRHYGGLIGLKSESELTTEQDLDTVIISWQEEDGTLELPDLD